MRFLRTSFFRHTHSNVVLNVDVFFVCFIYVQQRRRTRETVGRTVRQVHHVFGRFDQTADVQLERFGAVRECGVRLLVAAVGRRPVAPQFRGGLDLREKFRVLLVAAPPSRRGRCARSRGT